MKLRLKALMVSTALVAIMAPGAFAQEGDNPFARGRYTAVTERSQPEFDPLPVRTGVFEIDASLGASAAYNDNVFAEPNNPDDDLIIRVQPQVDARTTWSSHQVAMGASVDHREFSNNDSETSTDYNVYLNGRLDVTRTFALRAGVDSQHVTEERYLAGSNGAAEPAAFDGYGVFAGASYRMDRVQLDTTVGVREQEYDQVTQQQRDNTDTYINARASYAISPDVAVFVQGRRSELDYSQSIPNRDGSRTTVDVGVNFELAAPFRGEIAVGSFNDERDAASFGDTSGLSVAANVQWFPTQLTTVTFSAFRGATDPGLAASATAVTSNYGVRVDHELYRNVLLFGGVRMENYKFEGSIDREDEALAGWFGAAWKLNRHAHLEAMYSGRTQDSSGTGAGPDLDQNVLSVGVRFFP
jgi:hypothetical protein